MSITTIGVDGPRSSIDLWDTATLRDPFPAYARLRDLGPAVALERYDLVALPRYDEVAAALVDWRTYSSASGVGVDEQANQAFPPGVLWSDPPEHTGFRRVMAHQLGVRRVDGDTPHLERTAARLVETALARPELDVVADLARRFSEAVIGGVLGLPEHECHGLAQRASQANDFFGPAGERQAAGQSAVQALIAQALGLEDRLAAGSRGAELAAAGQATNIASYTWPGTDTLARVVSSALYLLARHPDQWDHLRRDPTLVPAAADEVMRLLSPVRHFSRRTTTDVRLGGGIVPAGTRILAMFASANRDERRFPDPDRFDITRGQGRHLAFGHGVHRCVGANLAHRAVHVLLGTVLERVDRVELAGDPVWTDNHTQYGLEHLPARLLPAR